MTNKYIVELQMFGESIIGFIITAKNYRRKYPIYLSREFETTKEFISRNTTDFLDEIKNLPKAKRLIIL